MNKIFEKIRKAIFGERLVNELGDLTLKNKKLTDNQKLKELIYIYGKYYKEKHESTVCMATWELYYEDFVIDGKTKNQILFDAFYKKCEDEITFVNIICLAKQIISLKNINLENCTKSEIDILNSIKILYKTYNQNFDYDGFYNNNIVLRAEVRNKNANIIQKILFCYNEILKQNQQEQTEK